jgi:hypothetical protein
VERVVESAATAAVAAAGCQRVVVGGSGSGGRRQAGCSKGGTVPCSLNVRCAPHQGRSSRSPHGPKPRYSHCKHSGCCCPLVPVRRCGTGDDPRCSSSQTAQFCARGSKALRYTNCPARRRARHRRCCNAASAAAGQHFNTVHVVGIGSSMHSGQQVLQVLQVPLGQPQCRHTAESNGLAQMAD